MSQENVDRFVKLIEGVQSRGHLGLFSIGGSRDPVYHRLAALQGDFVGVDAMMRWFADVRKYLENAHVHLRDVRDLGDDRVLVLGTLRATGSESGVETEEPFTVVATFRDGRLTEYTDFADPDRALEAAGLPA